MSFLIAAGIGLILVPTLRRVGLTVGLVDRPGPLKIHREPVPVTGGLAVTAATLVAVALAGGWLPPMIVSAVVLALMVGLLDDLRPTPAWVRVNLIAAAGVLASIELPLGPLGTFGTVLVVLACANGVNILDGQDGLAGGVSAVAALSLGVVLMSSGAVGPSLGLALGGALVAFVIWNRPPARVFLGNGGAYAVGATLGILAASAASTSGWRGIVAAGVCLAVLALEVASTVWRRLLSGNALGAGDRGHTYDLLAERLGRHRTLFIFWGLATVASALGIAVGLVPGSWWPAPAAFAGVLGAAATWTFGIAVRRARQETYVGEPVSSMHSEATITGSRHA